jgi:NAD(P)-dependent dehydrogenase (short-subunit alcohol dehydrogenase family)
VGAVDDVTGVIEFLLSHDAAYVTGENVAIDGGTLLSSTQMDPVLGPLLDL